jgi:hypothetical protein
VPGSKCKYSALDDDSDDDDDDDDSVESGSLDSSTERRSVAAAIDGLLGAFVTQ